MTPSILAVVFLWLPFCSADTGAVRSTANPAEIQRALVMERPGKLPLVYIGKALQLYPLYQTEDANGKVYLQSNALNLRINLPEDLRRESLHFLRPQVVSAQFQQALMEAGFAAPDIVLLRAALFDPSSDLLRNDASAELDRVILLMGAYPTASLVATAYTDSKGSLAFNRKLAERRAASIVKYLVDNGVVRSRITVKTSALTAADSLPFEDLTPEQIHQINRRAEFMLVVTAGL